MTAPAPRNHPAEDAHPAPTPAPVAVPEGGWRKGDIVVFRNGHVYRRTDRPLWVGETTTNTIGDGFMDRHVENGNLLLVRAPRQAYGTANDTAQHAPRPEPVVAPLPSEAVRQALVDLLIENRDRDYAASVYKFTPEKMADAILNAGYHLVPEDDEDTVRVPRVCESCRDQGWKCDLDATTIDGLSCPGEECASCDYLHGDLEDGAS